MVWVRGRSYPPSVERMGCFASEARGGGKGYENENASIVYKKQGTNEYKKKIIFIK
jgi:hypothetical protein